MRNITRELCLRAQFSECFNRIPDERECRIEYIPGSSAVIRLNVLRSEGENINLFLKGFIGSYDRYGNNPVKRYYKDRIIVTIQVYLPFVNFKKGL